VQELESRDDQIVVADQIDRRPPPAPAVRSLTAVECGPDQSNYNQLMSN